MGLLFKLFGAKHNLEVEIYSSGGEDSSEIGMSKDHFERVTAMQMAFAKSVFRVAWFLAYIFPRKRPYNRIEIPQKGLTKG